MLMVRAWVGGRRSSVARGPISRVTSGLTANSWSSCSVMPEHLVVGLLYSWSTLLSYSSSCLWSSHRSYLSLTTERTAHAVHTYIGLQAPLARPKRSDSSSAARSRLRPAHCSHMCVVDRVLPTPSLLVAILVTLLPELVRVAAVKALA